MKIVSVENTKDNELKITFDEKIQHHVCNFDRIPGVNRAYVRGSELYLYIGNNIDADKCTQNALTVCCTTAGFERIKSLSPKGYYWFANIHESDGFPHIWWDVNIVKVVKFAYDRDGNEIPDGKSLHRKFID